MKQELHLDLHIQQHPLTFLGCKAGRVVSLIRLASGKVIIHSTADFSSQDVATIRTFGEPGWLVDATFFHDTYARVGRTAFPDVPYLVPDVFPKREQLNATALLPAPLEWQDEIDIIEIAGMPKIQEHVIYHRASKTLIVADLLFNLPPEVGKWTLGFFRVAAGIREYPGMSRMFRAFIKDHPAFCQSMQKIAALDFETIVVGHGNPITENAKSQFQGLMTRHGFDIGDPRKRERVVTSQ